MKEMQFTTKELETLVWALNNQYHEKIRLRSKSGRAYEDETTERLKEICKKAGRLMIEAHKEESAP